MMSFQVNESCDGRCCWSLNWFESKKWAIQWCMRRARSAEKSLYQWHEFRSIEAQLRLNWGHLRQLKSAIYINAKTGLANQLVQWTTHTCGASSTLYFIGATSLIIQFGRECLGNFVSGDRSSPRIIHSHHVFPCISTSFWTVAA